MNLQAQYLSQRPKDTHSGQLLGLRMNASKGIFTGGLALTHILGERNMDNPFGGFAGYGSLMQSDFNRSKQTTGILFTNINGLFLGADWAGLTSNFAYSNGGEDPGTGLDYDNEWEVDFTLDMRPFKDEWYEFRLRIRESIRSRDGVTRNDFRVILEQDYTF